MNAVGFDLDYTLVVPTRDRKRILQAALDDVDGPHLTREEYRRGHERVGATETREPIFEAILEDAEDDEDAGDAGDAGDTDPAELATAYHDRILDAMAPVPGVEGMLDRLRDDYRIGLLTDGPVRAQRGKLEALGWTDRFDAVVITGTLPAGKPDRRAFDALLDRLGVAAGETAYVGDYPEVDVVGASDAGLRAVQVLTPDNSEPHPAADAVVDRRDLVDRLPDLLAELDCR